jgi:hypothetical protein
VAVSRCVHSVPLPGIQPLQVVDVFRRRGYWGVVLGADSEPADEVGFDVEHVPGGQGPDVFRQAGAGKQRHTGGERSRGESSARSVRTAASATT